MEKETCNKFAYTSEKAANTVLNYYNTRRRGRHFRAKDKMVNRSYRCPDCGMYHLTSSPKRDDKKKDEDNPKYARRTKKRHEDYSDRDQLQ